MRLSGQSYTAGVPARLGARVQARVALRGLDCSRIFSFALAPCDHFTRDRPILDMSCVCRSWGTGVQCCVMSDSQTMDSWDGSQPRRAVAISFIAALVFAAIVFYPGIASFLSTHPLWERLLAAIPVATGVALASRELRHSGEANELRVEANRFRAEQTTVMQKTLDLQNRIQQLQENIDKGRTKVRLFARVSMEDGPITLKVSNLSDFDLWINQVELMVKEAEIVQQGRRTLGGATRLSQGKTEDGYKLYDALVVLNGNRTESIDMKFHVEVVAVSLTEEPVTIKSPDYQVTWGAGKTRELKTLRW
jgi:hypothetical protein